MRFGFMGRVSDAAMQEIESSHAWQVARARDLISGHGEIVAEYFDVIKRSVGWPLRPEASKLLAALDDPNRAFDAVVIGEPHRAFGSVEQYEFVIARMTNAGVQLWVPEIGGPIDRRSEEHYEIMCSFARDAERESERARTRVLAAKAAQAKEGGRHLGGRPPYGYRLGYGGLHPNPHKASLGIRYRVLEIVPERAAVVQRIFKMFLGGMGLRAIAEQLNREGIEPPSAVDPQRNRHRDGRAWNKGSVRGILTNPRYTGYEIWGKQRSEMVLVDEEARSLGYEKKRRYVDPDTWVWSEHPVHPEIIGLDNFLRVQKVLDSRGPKTRDDVLYTVSGMLWHEQCDRRMQASQIHGKTYYVCAMPSDYARAKEFDHPANVSLREDRLLAEIDDWLRRVFGRGLDQSPEPDAKAVVAEIVRLKDEIAEIDRKLDRYRTIVDGTGDLNVVMDWIRQASRERQELADELARAEFADIAFAQVQRLERADNREHNAIYESLGLRVIYDHTSDTALIETSRPPMRGRLVFDVYRYRGTRVAKQAPTERTPAYKKVG